MQLIYWDGYAIGDSVFPVDWTKKPVVQSHARYIIRILMVDGDGTGRARNEGVEATEADIEVFDFSRPVVEEGVL